MAKPPHIDGERGYLTLFFSLSKLPARYRYTTWRRPAKAMKSLMSFR
jgi:hypothetical protein